MDPPYAWYFLFCSAVTDVGVRRVLEHNLMHLRAADKPSARARPDYDASSISAFALAPAQSLPPFQRHTSLPAASNRIVVGRFAP